MSAATELPVTAPGPSGPLAGTFLDAAPGASIVLVIPGSGPTDRDGNNPLGVNAATYRLLAEGLAAQGVSSVRIDKRGMFASAAAVADANAVTIADYVTDVGSWVAAIRARTGTDCVWLLGHSEGALLALASRQLEGVCGMVLVAGPGRRLGDILRAQLTANPANAPYLPQLLDGIATLEAGGSVDVDGLPPVVARMFAPPVQGFMRDLFSHDPAGMMAEVQLSSLIVQGDADLQVGVEDAQILAGANPRARLAILPDVNHVLKSVPRGDTAANLAAYGDPDLPLASGIAEAIAAFVKTAR